MSAPADLDRTREDRQFAVIRAVTRFALYAIAPGLLALNVLIASQQPTFRPVALLFFGLNWTVLAGLMLAGHLTLTRERKLQSFSLTAAGTISYVFGVLLIRENADVACSFGAVAIVVLSHLVGRRAFRRTVLASLTTLGIGFVANWLEPWPRLACPVWIKTLEALGVAGAILLLILYALQQRHDESESDLAAVRALGGRHALWADVGTQSVELLSRQLGGLEATIAQLVRQATDQQAMAARVTSSLHQMSQAASANATAANALIGLADGSRQAVAAAGESFAAVTREAERAVGLVDESRRLAVNVAELAAQVDQVLSFLQRIIGSLRVLSINARLEASRAGEAGKGFAVVVGELMKLLEETKGNFAQSKRLLGGIKGDAVRSAELSLQGARAVNDEAEAIGGVSGILDTMTRTLGDMTQLATPIGAAAHEQQVGVQEVLSATEQQRAVAGEIQRSVQGLSELSARLRELRERIEATAKAAG